MMASIREFFNTETYYYFYESKLFVSKEKLKSDIESNYSLDERLKLKSLYARAKRKIVNSCGYQKNFHHHIAEKIWRDEKSYEELLEELNELLSL